MEGEEDMALLVPQSARGLGQFLRETRSLS